MKNPFILKNGINESGGKANVSGDQFSFEEGVLDWSSGKNLERIADKKPLIGYLRLIPIVVFILLFGRLYYLAVASHDYYREVAEGNRLRIEYLTAPRGAVYDRYGEVLAGNRPSFEVIASPLDLPDNPEQRSEIIAKVAEIIGMQAKEIEELIFRSKLDSFYTVLIKQNLERDQALVFHEQADDLIGFRVVNVPIRDYQKSNFAYSHLFGYVGKITAEEYQKKRDEGYLFNDSIGKTGIEEVYEQYLRGEFGQRQVEVDAKGQVKKIFGERDALPGDNLVLNIDSGLQEKIYESLRNHLGEINRSRSAVMAMDPRNGEMLAYISLPGYDNNEFAEGINAARYQQLLTDPDRPIFNRAITGAYPPGSTVKGMVAAAALEENVVTPKTIIEDRGSIVIENIYGGPDYFFYGYNRAGLGPVDVKKAIALSSDIFFYVVGGGYDPLDIEGLGVWRLADYYRRFGLGKALGIDLPGEKAGLVPDPDWKQERFAGDPVNQQWYLGNTYHLSIGQGDLLTTPLQVLSWTATIANSGNIYKPQIAKRIEDSEGNYLKVFEPELLDEINISQESIKFAQEGMRMAVSEGTARYLNTLPIAAAGKTGTAQFDARDLSRTHAWFTAYAPYENPEIALVVLIEDGGEGSYKPTRIAREALEWWAENRYGQ